MTGQAWADRYPLAAEADADRRDWLDANYDPPTLADVTSDDEAADRFLAEADAEADRFEQFRQRYLTN